MAQSIGRNDPCVCGSGKKYKKCCINIYQTDERQEELRLQQIMKDKLESEFSDGQFRFSTAEELGIEKMSEIILEFIDDLLEQTSSHEEAASVMGLAVVAWNLALLPMSDQRKKLDDFLADLKNPLQEKYHEDMLLQLIKRKLECYPDIYRLIVRYEVLKTPEGPHLNIASTYFEG